MARRDGQHFDCETWLHKARALPKDDFRREVEKELAEKETESSELISFKVYKSHDLDVHHREFRSDSGQIQRRT